MKTKSLYGAAALAALTLASCSQEEVMNVRQDGIAYNVLANNQTRAVDSYCNTNKPKDFKVWAYNASEGLYFGDEKISEGSGGIYNSEVLRYWPQYALDFYAHVNGEGFFDFNNGAPKFNNFTVKPEVADQVDLMYAIQLGATNNGSPVNLNFRHALSQVCFRAENKTPYLQIAIKSVKVGHLTDGGTYTFPTESTDKNYTHPDHSDAVDNDYNPSDYNGGEWTLNPNNNSSYTAYVNAEANEDGTRGSLVLAPNSGLTNLTCPAGSITPDENGDVEGAHANGFENVMTLMPQAVQAWNPASNSDDGAYFVLDVVITDTNLNKEVYAGGAVVPVHIDWKQGVRYIYTFIFNGNGDGGYVGGEGGVPPTDPKPVLVGVKYTVSTDDFVAVTPGNGDSVMDTENDGKLPGEENPDQPQQPTEPTTTEYKLNLNIDKGNGNVDTESFTFEQLPASVNMGSYTVTAPEGYDFMGWSLTEGATDAEYAPNAAISFPNLQEGENNVTVYAVYKKYYIYTLNFLAADMSDELVDTSTLPSALTQRSYDESYEFTIPSTRPSCGNYKFLGWAETDDWDASTPNVKPGEKITLTKDQVTKNLYTVWTTGADLNPDDQEGENWD